jgi:hypothetical protein
VFDSLVGCQVAFEALAVGLQKVGTQLEVSKPVPQVVNNSKATNHDR